MKIVNYISHLRSMSMRKSTRLQRRFMPRRKALILSRLRVQTLRRRLLRLRRERRRRRGRRWFIGPKYSLKCLLCKKSQKRKREVRM